MTQKLSVQCQTDHDFKYLRTTKSTDLHGGAKVWLLIDVFFCSRCLTYKSKETTSYTPPSNWKE